MSDLEPVTVTQNENIVEALKKPWDQVVVDIGSNGYISTSPENTLLILADPRQNPNDLDWGENEPDSLSEVIAVRAEVEKIAGLLSQKVDRVQMIAPDPDLALGHVKVATELVKEGGQIVLAFDRNSNKKDNVRKAVREIIDSLDSSFEVEIGDIDKIDLEDLVEGSISSDYNLRRILILTKKQQ